MVTRALLNKFMDGRCSAEELEMLKQYFRSGDTSGLDDILEEDWKDIEEEVPNQAFAEHRKRILARLGEEVHRPQPPVVESKTEQGSQVRPVWARSIAAAVLLCMLALGAKILLNKSEGAGGNLESNLAMTERRNDEEVPVTLTLSDGSTVVLEPKSTLHFPEKFQGDKRIVRLEGQAFFDVSKDSLNPFFVKTNSLNVRVIGTSFNISSFQDKPSEVSVVTGKVAVFVAEQKESLILTPNERVVRINENTKLAKELVKEPVIIRRETLTRLFDFDEAPVSEVFLALESAYHIHIHFDANLVKNRTLKARLDDQPLFVKLDMICASLGLEYEIEGTDIMIKKIRSHE